MASKGYRISLSVAAPRSRAKSIRWSSQSSVGTKPRGRASYDLVTGSFSDSVILEMEWWTTPLTQTVGALAGLFHGLSSLKLFSKKKNLPASRDLFHSCIYIRVKHLCPPESKVRRRLPRFLRRLLNFLFPCERLYKFEFGAFGKRPDASNLQAAHVDSSLPDEYLKRTIIFQMPPPFTHYQEAVLRKWNEQPYLLVGKSNCNQFARESLEWGEERAA